MKINILLKLLLTLFMLQSCNQVGSPPKSPEELRMELKSLEQSNPIQFLTVDAKMRDSMVKTREEGWFNKAEYGKNGNTIKGFIKNSASIAKFKDVVLTVSYYSATKTVIKSEDHIFYEFYEPNSLVPFSIHVYPPKEMKSFGLNVKNASATE